jgi:hypothetical protein
MSLILFFFSYFLDRVACFCLGLAVDCNHPTFASWGAGTTDLYTIPNIVEMEVSLTFCLLWPQTVILLLSASHIIIF